MTRLIIGTDHQQCFSRNAIVLPSTLVSGWCLQEVPQHGLDLQNHKAPGVKLLSTGTC